MSRISNPILYFLVLCLLSFVLLASLGELVWGAAASGELHWTEKLFFDLCHQLPDRTYSVGETMMAVNTRCFGIFLGIAAGWMVLPLTGRYTAGSQWPVIFLIVTITLQIVDYLGNLTELWQNTNHSRAFLGALFGAALSISVSDMFIKRKNLNS